MLISPRRPTAGKLGSRKSSALRAAHRRMVVSMPNLQDLVSPEPPPRNASLRKMEMEPSDWDCGSGDAQAWPTEDTASLWVGIAHVPGPIRLEH